MPRKSAASLAIAPPPTAISGMRLPPPDHLTEAARAVWREIVGACPANFFDRAAVPLLETLAHSTAEHRRLTAWLADCSELADITKLSRLIDTHAARIAQASTRLRITNQSRYNPRQAGKAAADLSPADRIRQNYGA